MPKHGLAPTRDKPSADPTVGGALNSTPVVLSNEVLLRSKIAQLQLEKAKQQRKTKIKNKGGVGSSSSPSPAAAAAAARPSCLSSSLSNADHGSGDWPSRHAPDITSRHQLANIEAASGRSRKGKTGAAAACGRTSGGGETTTRAESEEEALRRFEDQIALAGKNEESENDAPEESSTSSGQQQQRPWCGFTPKGIQQALRDMYREQVRAARSMNKHADILTRKTQEIEKSNEIMRAEAEASAHEAVRLEQATSKLHTLSGELDAIRKAMLETRKAEAAEETSRREEMNASLNAVVSDISKKIKEQEEERIAQDAENASLRSDLQ
ncbi:unnamed protein product, partial [Hapterophycus canaliculatus]